MAPLPTSMKLVAGPQESLTAPKGLLVDLDPKENEMYGPWPKWLYGLLAPNHQAHTDAIVLPPTATPWSY